MHTNHPTVHENKSLLEECALAVLALIGLAVVLAILTNLNGLKRYIRIKSM